MKNNIQKLALGAACVSAILISTGANAETKVEKAFGALGGSSSSSTAAQKFKTSTATGYFGGSYDVRINNNKYSIALEITKPKISAGCNGISAHLGGISWIQFGDVKEMLNNIAKSTGYVVVQLALSVLMPPLEKLINQVSAMLQQIAQASLDSCAAGQALGGAAFNMGASALAKATDGAEGSVGKWANDTAKRGMEESCMTMMTGLENFGSVAGMSSSNATDWNAARTESCGSGKNALGSIYDFFKTGSEKTKQRLANELGNSTFNALSYVGYGGASNWPSAPSEEQELEWYTSKINASSDSDKAAGRQMIGVLLYNWMGSTIRPLPPAAGSADADKSTDPRTEKPILTGEDIIAIMMCGNNLKKRDDVGDTTKDKTVDSYCQEKSNKLLDKVLALCTDRSCSEAEKKYYTVEDLVKGTAENDLAGSLLYAKSFAEYSGTIAAVDELLITGALNAVKNNTPLTPEQQALIVSVPFPVWKVLNVAAVMPTLGEQILKDNAQMIALMITGSILQNAVNDISNVAIKSDLPGDVLVSIMSSANLVHLANTTSQENLLRLVESQNAMMEKVRLINKSIAMNAAAVGISSADFAGQL